MAICGVCFRHCDIPEGGRGFCGVRTCSGGTVVPANYGRMTSMALDPVEKKPLKRFHPGKYILSVGSYGCDLHCPFCQNHEISWSEEALRLGDAARYVSPEELAGMAEHYKSRGNIGVAYTYNEPLIGYEYVRDAARAVHEKGMLNVMVTNGMAEPAVWDELAPYIDALNIDLKSFSHSFYRDVLKGSLDMVLEFISRAAKTAHVEITTLIIPGGNDTEEEIKQISGWISQLIDADGNIIGGEIPLHISRFFPRFRMNDRPPTDVGLIYRLAERAREDLKYVYTGNC